MPCNTPRLQLKLNICLSDLFIYGSSDAQVNSIIVAELKRLINTMNLFRKSKKLLQPKRKGDASDDGIAPGTSSTQAEPPREGQYQDATSKVEALVALECPSQKTILPEDEQEPTRIKSKTEYEEEIQVKGQLLTV
jgi:hypothetical protein